MARQALFTLFLVLAFGILVPWYRGISFLDPRMIAAYTSLSILFVAPSAADSFAKESDRSASRTVGKLAMVVAYGWGIMVLVLLTALFTLNLAYGRGSLITPPRQLFWAVLAASLAASIAVGALSALLARSFSAMAVKSLLRICFLLVLAAFVFNSRMPDAWQIALSEHTTRRAITNLAWKCAAIFALLGALLLVPLLRKSGRPGA